VLPEPTTTCRLPDGRLLAADDVGDPAGVPVVYLHGAPDCRLARHPDDAVAAASGVRLVALDRPGYGWSDPPAPDVLTFGDDVGRLLDDLGVGTCSVAAWSAGAPWAFGTAVALGDRVRRVVTSGAVAPLEALREPAVAAASGARAAMASAVLDGELTVDELVDELAMLLVPSPPPVLELAYDSVVESLGAAGVAALDEVPGALDVLAHSFAAAVERHGDAGLRADIAVQVTPGLDAVLADVACPVVLVHGDGDDVSRPPVGEWMAARLPDAGVEVWDGAGHQALLVHWQRWLRLAAG
jgi:pimeloyl-ACP methyl ester carboxylesterase